MNNENIAKLKEQILVKSNAITESGRELSELRKQLLEAESGLKCGDKVMNEDGTIGILCYNNNSMGYNWNWRKIKKNGEISVKSCYLTVDYSTLKKVE